MNLFGFETQIENSKIEIMETDRIIRSRGAAAAATAEPASLPAGSRLESILIISIIIDTNNSSIIIIGLLIIIIRIIIIIILITITIIIIKPEFHLKRPRTAEDEAPSDEEQGNATLTGEVEHFITHMKEKTAGVRLRRSRMYYAAGHAHVLARMHQPGMGPGSCRWQRCILPLDH